MSRHYTGTKRIINQYDLTVLILAAGEGRRCKSLGAKSLIKVDDSNLVNNQIKVIRKVFPDIRDIILVLGFDIEKIYKTIPEGVKVVENENFNQTNAARSLFMGAKACTTNNLVVLHGDILFNEKYLEKFRGESALLFDKTGKISNDKVGGIPSGGLVSNLDFGLENKWAQICLFSRNELDILRKIMFSREKYNLCVFEVINMIINQGGNFKWLDMDESAYFKEFNSVNEILEFKYKNGQDD